MISREEREARLLNDYEYETEERLNYGNSRIINHLKQQAKNMASKITDYANKEQNHLVLPADENTILSLREETRNYSPALFPNSSISNKRNIKITSNEEKDTAVNEAILARLKRCHVRF